MSDTPQFDQFTEDFLHANAEDRPGISTAFLLSIGPEEFCRQTIGFVLDTFLRKQGIDALAIVPLVRGDDGHNHTAQAFFLGDATPLMTEDNLDLAVTQLQRLQELGSSPYQRNRSTPFAPSLPPDQLCYQIIAYLFTHILTCKGIDALAVVPFVQGDDRYSYPANAFFLGKVSPLATAGYLDLAIHALKHLQQEHSHPQPLPS